MRGNQAAGKRLPMHMLSGWLRNGNIATTDGYWWKATGGRPPVLTARLDCCSTRAAPLVLVWLPASAFPFSQSIDDTGFLSVQSLLRPLSGSAQAELDCRPADHCPPNFLRPLSRVRHRGERGSLFASPTPRCLPCGAKPAGYQDYFPP
jgi:hypothetical protein